MPNRNNIKWKLINVNEKSRQKINNLKWEFETLFFFVHQIFELE